MGATKQAEDRVCSKEEGCLIGCDLLHKRMKTTRTSLQHLSTDAVFREGPQ